MSDERQEHQLRFQMDQQPLFDLDPHDAAATRAWRRRCVEEEVTLTGHLPLRIVHVGVGLQRIGKLELRIEPKIELQHAGLFLVTARHPDVVRSYREGEIVVDGPDSKVRAVVTLEYAHATGRWWTARRRVGTNQVAVGVFHGEWVESEGEGLEALDEALREWVDTTGIELGDAQQELTPTEPKSELWMGFHTLNQDPPTDAKGYADVVGGIVDKELMNRYPTGLEVFAFKGRHIEQFILRGGDLPIPLDDFVRALAARGPADAIALRTPGVAEVDGESYRAVFCSVEFAGRRVDRVVALKFGPQGRPVGSRVFYDDRGAVGPEGCWLGVKPKHGDVDLFMMQAPGGFAPES